MNEALLFNIAFCIAGVLIGWELKSVILKFKGDRKREKLEQFREEVKERARSDAQKGLQAMEQWLNEKANQLKPKDPIITEAEKIISDHFLEVERKEDAFFHKHDSEFKKKVLKSIRDAQKGQKGQEGES